MVSIRPLISKSSSPCINPFVTVLPRASITTDIIFTFIFYSFFKQGRSTYFLFHLLSVSLCGQPEQQSPQFCKFSFYWWLIITRSGSLVEIRWFDYYYYYSLRAFHISFRRWFFTGVWVTASLLKSPGLFTVFWPFSIMLSFGWSPLVRQFPSPLVPLVIL